MIFRLNENNIREAIKHYMSKEIDIKNINKIVFKVNKAYDKKSDNFVNLITAKVKMK